MAWTEGRDADMADDRWREDEWRGRGEDPARQAERDYGRDYGGSQEASRRSRDENFMNRPGRSSDYYRPSDDYGSRRPYDDERARTYRRQRYADDAAGYDRDRPYGSGDYSRGPDYGAGYYGADYYGADYGNYRPGWGERGENRYRDDERPAYSQRWSPDRSWWDRASDELSSWLGDEQAQRRRALDEAHRGHYGRGPRGYVRSDERIREDINDRLTEDWLVDASDISVAVAQREVVLSGTVNTRREKRRAEDIAESVSGVEQVQNNIRIRRSAVATTPDSATEETLGTGAIVGSTTAVDLGSRSS